MDLTIPYTLYPVALPHWIAWLLFVMAVAGGVIAGIVRARGRGWVSGLGTALIGGVGLLLATMIVSMVITFFMHDL